MVIEPVSLILSMPLVERNYSELDLPPILYKYKCWHRPFGKDILENSQVYFAPHKSFGEKSELNLPQDYASINRQVLFDFFYRDGMTRLQMPPFLAYSFASFWILRTPFANDGHRVAVEEQFQEDLNNNYGILSMCDRNNNSALWDLFSYENGIVIGINSEFMFTNRNIQCTAGYVEYYSEDNKPSIKPLSNSDDERVLEMNKTIFSLPDDFDDEEEFRLGKHISQTGRYFPINPDCILEVIIGQNTSLEYEQEILTFKPLYNNAVFYKQEVTNGIMSFQEL